MGLSVVFGALQACATPVAPTGGPRDTQGPTIIETIPETGTVNFSHRRISFKFDEYVSRTSLNNNVTIEPDLGLVYTLKWKKKTLNIEFSDALPDSTTIIITLSGNITDTRNNKMGAPITVAVSTGDEIDEGSINGILKHAHTGEALESEKVYLYRSPIDLASPYAYQAETDTGGVFSFTYLREGEYQALYFDDRNRNKIWDIENEFAQPFLVERMQLEKKDTLALKTIYIQRSDTLAPRLQAVGMLSDRRLRFRFNEDIKLGESPKISVTDSIGALFSTVFPLYVSRTDPFILYARSEFALNENRSYALQMQDITDVSGNQAITTGVSFSGSAQADTTRQRIIEVETQGGLFPDQSFTVLYADYITDFTIIDSVVVAEGDLTFDEWPAIRVDGNRLYIDPQGSWIDGIEYQFLIWNPYTRRRALHTPEIWDAVEMGELEISIPNADSSAIYYVQIENHENTIYVDSVMNSSMVIDNLPPLNYKLTLFRDINGNGFWDKGAVVPYQQPEPYYVRQTVNVRTGFTAEVIIEF